MAELRQPVPSDASDVAGSSRAWSTLLQLLVLVKMLLFSLSSVPISATYAKQWQWHREGE